MISENRTTLLLEETVIERSLVRVWWKNNRWQQFKNVVLSSSHAANAIRHLLHLTACARMMP